MELPSIPDTDEPDVILADCQQWKSDDEQLTNLLHDKFAELVTFFHLVPQANVNINNIYIMYIVIYCDVVTFPLIKNTQATRFSSDIKKLWMLGL